MTAHDPYGKMDVPFAEPAWYRGAVTPYYNEHHAAFRHRMRQWVDASLIPFVDEWDEKGTMPIEEVRRSAAAAGVLCPWAPAELGGTPPEGGWDEFMLCIWIDELTRCGAGGVVILIQITFMALPHILTFGSDHLKEKIAKPVARGEQGIAITLTEPQGGSDLANLTTTALKTTDGKHYVVNGQKKFITGGMCVAYFSTMVRTGGPGMKGLSIVVIPADSPGIKVSKLTTTGWWAGNTTLITFDDVKVPVENLIGDEGMGMMIMASAMNGERFVACVGPLRAARMLLSESIDFARQRKTFGKRLIDHQVIRHKIAHMARLVEAGQATIEALAFQMKNGASPLEIGGSVSLAKVQCTSAYELCAREASQIFGGNSFLRQGKGALVERMVRELRVTVVGGGSEEILIDLAMRMAKL